MEKQKADAASGQVGDPRRETGGSYGVDAILRACNVLHAFHFKGETIALKEIVSRTGLHKATAFRTAQSLVEGGLLEKTQAGQYRSRVHIPARNRVRIGYASMSENSVFSRDVTDGLRLAAQENDIELIECDNRYSAKVAIRNAEMLVKERVDVAIEVQIHEQVAPIVAQKFHEAKIPLIAVDIPHPGAVFFGGNNYVAGRIAGRALARWAQKRLGGEVDAVLLLALPAAGPIPAARMTGVAVGIKELLPSLDETLVTRLDGKGGYVESMEAVRNFLGRKRLRRILVGTQNDASALGALRALEEAGCAEHSAVVGQNATAAGRAEIRKPNTRMIGSVAFFPELYGKHLVQIALDILAGKPVPPAIFVKHVLIDKSNVDHYYPNDALLTTPDSDTLLWNFYH
jgi:ribose transport system substrate-binding protein